MLIRQAFLLDGRTADIRGGHRIEEVAPALAPHPGEPVFDARGCTVIPGLHDHHVHLFAAAAAVGSVRVGPESVNDREELRRVMNAAAVGADGWIRGIGYHDAVAGPLDRAALDELRPEVPVRIQHRSGVLWYLNSAGLRLLGLADHPDGVVRSSDPTWSESLGRRDLELGALSRELTGYGVTGVTDATPDPPEEMREAISVAQGRGEFVQRVSWLAPGKRILHDDALDLDELASWICERHGDESPVAIHCVTSGQLVVTMAALRAAGVRDGDRIEHAAVVPSDMVGDLAELGVIVVTQPNFIAERGDQYRRDVASDEMDSLWRLGSMIKSGVRMAISTDMPFGRTDPWRAMRSAVQRRTVTGHVIGGDERVSAQQALSLFQGTADRPHVPRTIMTGQPGELCVLRGAPADVLRDLDSSLVAGTFVDGVFNTR